MVKRIRWSNHRAAALAAALALVLACLGIAEAQSGAQVPGMPPGFPIGKMPPTAGMPPSVGMVPSGGTTMPDARPAGLPPSDGAMMLPLLLRSASLSPEQDTRVRQIINKGRLTTQTLVEQLKQAEDKLADQIVSVGPLRASDVQPQLDRIIQLRQQLLQEAARVSLEIRSVLTPDQLARAQQVKDRMRVLHAELRQLTEPARP